MKKWKIIVTALVLIVAAGAGTIYYFLDVNQYNTKDTKVDKIVKNNYNIKLPGNDSHNQGNNGQAQQSTNLGTKQTTPGTNQTVASSQTGQDNSKSGSKGNSSNSSTTATAKANSKAGSSATTEMKVSASSILAKYGPVFKDLENQANGKIDTLLSYAIDEYSAKKAKGEEISYFYFYAKYNAAGKELEDSSDASFNYIYSALVSELQKNGYSASVADPIKQQYTSMKNARRSALLKKAIAHFS